MSESTRSGLSRRSLVSSAVLAGALGAAATPRAQAATADQSGASEAVRSYFAWRAAAADAATRGAKLTTGPRLAGVTLGIERDRAAYLGRVGALWGVRGQSVTANSKIVGLDITGDRARARVVDTTEWTWWQARTDKADSALAAAEPRKYGIGEPDRLISSAQRVHHEVTLGRTAAGWSVLSDDYREDSLLGATPGYARAGWAAAMDRPANHTATGAKTSVAFEADLSAGTYRYADAAAYAVHHALWYSKRYCEYNSCGGDCANFVSQALFAGGQRPGKAWNTAAQPCPCATSTTLRAGTLAWVNNWELRRWLLFAGRAVKATGAKELGLGDVINYDWNGNGTFDHVTIVTNARGPLISAHNSDHRNVLWNLGGAPAYRFNRMLTTYGS